MPRAIKYTPLPHQRDFHSTKKPKTFLSSGFGGGKTYALVMHMFELMRKNPFCQGGILAPSYKEYKRDIVPTFYDVCGRNGIPFKYNKADFFWEFPDTKSTVYVYSSQEPMSIIGANLGWGAINEVASCSELAFKRFLGRIRDSRAKFRQLAMVGTPEGFNWTYEYFWEKRRSDTNLVIGDATANTHVHPDYFEDLRQSYDPLMAKQYIDGIPVNLHANAAIHAFDRKTHVKEIDYDPLYPIWVALDFNVGVMAASICQPSVGAKRMHRGMKKPYDIAVVDELAIHSSNTEELADRLIDWVGIDNLDWVSIFPDPAGRARHTNAAYTDIDILRQKGFNNIYYKKAIRVRDCINATNAKFSRDEIVINSKCKNLIADLEQCVYKEGSFELDKSNPMRTHWLDGLKNMIDYKFPIIRRRPPRTERVW